MSLGIPSVNYGIVKSNQRRSRHFLYPLLVGCFAIFYGGVLSQIPTEQFKDFSNYLIYADNALVILLGRMGSGLIGVLANEPVWLLINAGLGALLEPEAAVRTLIFLSASTVAWLILLNRPQHFIWLLVFLLLPVVVKNHLLHLRQGVAIAIFLWGWFSPRHAVRWLLMGMAPFIHASFFFVLAVLWCARAMRFLSLGADVRTLVFVAIGVVTGVALGNVAALLGARQAEGYEFTTAQVSGLGFVFWLFVLVVWLSAGRQFLRLHAFETGMVVFYLSTYWMVEVTARIFESGMLLVLLAGLVLPGWRRQLFLGVTVVYGGLTWLLRVSSPAMGFGVGG